MVILANRATLEILWRRNTEQYLHVYDSPPCSSWFGFDAGYPYIFHVSDCKIIERESGHLLKFNDGRHRTRWLLNNTNLVHIPIGLRREYLPLAMESNLLIKQVDPEEELKIHWDPTYIDFSKYVYP
jgi:hypothetical protein